MSLTRIIKIARVFPIETFFIFIPSAFGLCLIYVFLGNSGWETVGEYHFIRIIRGIFFDNPLFGNILIYPAVYIILRYLIGRLPINHRRHIKSKALLTDFVGKDVLKGILRASYWGLGIFLFCVFLNMSIGVLSHIFSNQHIAFVSQSLMRADLLIFNGYPIYSSQPLSHIPLFGTLMAFSYIWTPALLGILFLGLLFSDLALFRKFFLTSVFACFIALPFWAIFPAVTPNEMYRHNIFSVEIPSDIVVARDAHPLSKLINAAIGSIEPIWIDPENRTISVTTMPSMHVIWGLEVAFFGYLLLRRFAPIFLLYVFANTLSTVVLLEHYAIDVFAGAIVFILALFAASAVLRLERRYFTDEIGLVRTLSSFSRDAKVLQFLFMKFIKRLSWRK